MDKATGIDLVEGAGVDIAKTMFGSVAVYEIASTAGGGGASLTDTHAWMPLIDSDGLVVLDSTGALIPTLIAL